jgi:hypothetical protein
MSKGFRFMVAVAALSALALGGCASFGRGGADLAPYGGASESAMTGPSGAPGETYPGGPPSGGG